MFTAAPPPDGDQPEDDAYQRHKEQAAALQRKKSAAAREIAADCPPIKNPKRRTKALADFLYFCRVYMPDVFYLKFSSDHIRVGKKIQQVIEEGGLFAEAMPRGNGKTVFCEAGCLWGGFKGLHPMILLIGATADASRESLEKLRLQLETNDLLLEDFPEVCYPIRRLEGIYQRRLLWNGERIRACLKGRQIVFPNLPPSPAASCCIAAAGLTGRIRGMKFARPDGRDVRPTLVLPDDPQTDQSAASPAQCAKREKLINGAVLGLAGAGKKISALMPCTVVATGDMADRLLDRDISPQWQGERLKFIYKFPTHPDSEKHWAEYADIYRRCKKDGKTTDAATKFYRKNRQVMDQGAELAWKERFNDDEISALQHAYNFRITRGDAAFFAEYQNEPLRPKTAASILPTPDQIAARFDRRERCKVPIWSSHLTAFVDVHDELLYWMVCAFDNGFKGAVVDYGTFPEQDSEYFALASAKRRMSDLYPGAGLESRLTLGLNALYDFLLLREWKREDGRTSQKMSRCLTDANYGASRDTVYQVIGRRAEGNLLLPSHGYGCGPGQRQISDFKGTPSDIRGRDWQVTNYGKGQLHCNFDANSWKSFLFQRLAVPPGDPGSLVLFGDNPHVHRLLADHWFAETFDRITSERTGVTKDMYSLKAGRPDNHYLDNIIGCLLAASIDGCVLEIPGVLQVAPQRRRRISVSF